MNFINCPALFELCCAVIAADFKGKDFEEIKKQYGLDDVEYTPEDEEEIMKEYPWIMEETEARIKKLREENGIWKLNLSLTANNLFNWDSYHKWN